MSSLTELLAQAKAKDPQMGADLEREIKALSARRAFGLNFERHRPEAVELPGRPVRKGDKVRVLPARGETAKGDPRLWSVQAIATVDGARVARLELTASAEPETQTVTVADLVVVAEFRDTLYPGLVSTDRIERGGDKPWHTVINAENYLALKALTYTHRGRIDAIYIDPPYNTGARDWKYNNDYVEAEDLYRHSKWLAMMERRLLLARELLNPANSVLIVTIDEKEYLRLGLLLEQTFPDAQIQMISSVIKPGGTSRSKLFSRVEEFLFFVFFGDAEVYRTGDAMLAGVSELGTVVNLKESDLWEGMVRRGIGVVRSQRPKQFYPIFIDPQCSAIREIGEPLDPDVPRDLIQSPDDLVAVWPIKDDGTEGFWQLSPPGLRQAMKRGTARVGTFNHKTGQWRIQYMKAQKARYIDEGTVKVIGKDANGVVILETGQELVRERATARSVWTKASHDASVNGAGLINRFLPGRKFPFPKSIYAVEDALRFFVKDNPAAIILDFFAGSGTTAHAVMRLNRQDGGRRQCISITNNEVAADEHRTLREQGLRPGDPEWERLGICEHITKPRIRAAITGQTPDGAPIAGDYKFTDEFPMAEGFAENAEFFTLTFETPLAVSHQRAFERIAPLLWLRAGSQGARIDTIPESGWAVVDRYGLLTDLDRARDFGDAVAAVAGLLIAFIVTNDERRFQAVARHLPATVEPVRLYESYLSNFRIAHED
ncbi:DNA methyltransferase [Thiocapsa sp.]|uniref:DNA methyltransferase n=1 Tax=Thiocapsa sp. TaxID=2024551 RepID=UPI003592F098